MRFKERNHLKFVKLQNCTEADTASANHRVKKSFLAILAEYEPQNGGVGLLRCSRRELCLRRRRLRWTEEVEGAHNNNWIDSE